MARVTKFERDLRAAFERHVGAENVTLALRILRFEISNAELEAIPAVAALIGQCYHRPSRHDARMTALDSLLGTHGVEALGDVEQHDGPPAEYLNVGESYAATVVWYRDSGKFRIEGWADAAERLGL